MKVFSVSALIMILLIGCSLSYNKSERGEIIHCFNSKDEASKIGEYLKNNKFIDRTRYSLDGKNGGLEGLSLSWGSGGACTSIQSELKMIYEPNEAIDFSVKDILAAANMNFIIMRKEYNAL